MLGLRFCARAVSSCGERGPLFIAVRGPLTIAASLVAEHRLQTRRLSSCGSRAQLPRGMWDLPRPGLEPVSPALAGRFSTTAPPGKPLIITFYVSTYELCLGLEEASVSLYQSTENKLVYFLIRKFWTKVWETYSVEWFDNSKGNTCPVKVFVSNYTDYILVAV